MALNCVSHLPFLGFAMTVMRNIPKQLVYRKFSRGVKGRGQKAVQDRVDIEEILRTSGVTTVAPVTSTSKSVATKGTNSCPKDDAFKKWQASEERTNLLKQGERRLVLDFNNSDVDFIFNVPIDPSTVFFNF